MNKWVQDRILPGLTILAILNAVYAYGDVKQLKIEMVSIKSALSTVGDIKKVMCLLALKTTDDRLKEKICAGSISH